MYIKTLFTLVLAMGLTMNTEAQESQIKWPAFGAYQKVMSTTWKSAEEGNLAPLRKQSSVLVTCARKLLNSPLPPELRTYSVAEALKTLETKSINLDKLVKKKANDEALNESLSELHDAFDKVESLSRNKE